MKQVEPKEIALRNFSVCRMPLSVALHLDGKIGNVLKKTLSKRLGLISGDIHPLVFWEECADSDSVHDKVTQTSEAK